MKEKDQSIETLRGLAIILVVAGYIIKDDLGHNGHTLISSALKFSYYLLKPIRMPLFTVISAYLYAESPAIRETFKKLVTGKARRIMIPFTVVSAMQYIFYHLAHVKGPHPLHEIYKIYIVPFEQFWFLYSIFCIFIFVGFMDSIKAFDTFKKWGLWFALALALNAAFEPTRLFSINGTNYLLPFFLMGYGIRCYTKELFTPRMITVYVGIALAAYAYYVSMYVRHLTDNPKWIALLISISAVPLIFHFRKTFPFFAKVGYYAFGIHVFNKIASTFPRMIFERYGIREDGILFVTYLTVGISLAIVMQLIAEQFSFSRKYILGLKDAPKPSVEFTPVPIFHSWARVRASLVAITGIIGIFVMSHASMASSLDRVAFKMTGSCFGMHQGHECMVMCKNCRSSCHHPKP
jgi:glucans biosynthesis protein C